MLLRVVYVMASVLTVLPVIASDLESENKQTFQLASNPDVNYQQWSDSPSMVKQDSVPPPPPGPYISSGLSDLPAQISNRAERNKQTSEIGQVSPLIRPDAPWPGQRERPTMWKPEAEVAYGPNIDPVTPDVNRMSPPMNMQPGFMPPHPGMYQPIPRGDFVRPQFNQPQMNQQRLYQPQMYRPQVTQQQMYRPQVTQQQMYRPQVTQQQMYQQQEKQRQVYQQRIKQQQEMQQMHQQQINQPQMNQRAPVWNDFPIPMSNYPRRGQRAGPPIQR